MRKAKSSMSEILEDALKIGVAFILVIVIGMMIIAVFDKTTTGEAPIGSFDAHDFNTDWKLIRPDSQILITLPIEIKAKPGDNFSITNMLPADLNDGMSLMVRASMEDVRIYVDDRERAVYSADGIEVVNRYNPSAYVVATLNSVDSGKPIRIDISTKVRGTLNGVTIGDGNNVWFRVLAESASINMIAILVLFFGVTLLIALILLGNAYKTGAMKALSLLMIDVGMWVISESRLRQLFFARPSLSYYFSFFTIEIVGILACMFFDEIQHREYHKSYIIVECLGFTQLMVNIALHIFGACDMYNSLKYSHLWMAVSAVTVFVNLAKDIQSRRILKYKITACGVAMFVLLSLGELVKFYFSAFSMLGSYMCMGLMALMIATIIQTIFDETEAFKIREQNHKDMTFNTIETIASAIDARDEYTGGHSERVGYYARRLAREMAADYDFSEEDITRIHYIGLVHDIGKIGVADNVLNKSGKLTDEEFSLMKKHPELGYEIMTSMGSEVEGLLDGIRYHHERFDGNGYPDRLAGEDIPLVARIIGLADSYDAMTSNRVYRKRLSDEEVRNEILRCAGTQFDPALATIFIRLIDNGEITPQTSSGVALNESGEMLTSSLLETILQNDMRDKKKVTNPSHIRMMCYIIKLMEKKGEGFRVIFTKMPSEDAALRDKLNKTLRDKIGKHDMIVEYTEKRSIVALYNRTEQERDAFISDVKAVCKEAELWPLHALDEENDQ